jgi:TniQ
MRPVYITDPAWWTTFPHLVAPLPDEWLLGLLLRCDEENHWPSKTTLLEILRPGPERFRRFWYMNPPNLTVIQPSLLKINYIVQFLDIPPDAILATTYHTELARYYGKDSPHPKNLNSSLSFHLCPECVAKERMLRRSLTLPHITVCPLHQVALLEQCQCGASLRLFHRLASPFTCHACGMDWADLPRIKASSERVMLEQKFLSWYEFLFYCGESPTILYPLRLIHSLPLSQQSRSDDSTLGSVVAFLIRNNFSPDDARAIKI